MARLNILVDAHAEESMGSYSPRSMSAAKLLLSASRVNSTGMIRKGGGGSATCAVTSRVNSGRSKSLDVSSPYKLTPAVPPSAPFPTVAAAAAAAVQEAMATVLATRQCFVAVPPQPKKRASGSKMAGASARARSQSCPEVQQDALDLLASLRQPQQAAPQQQQPALAPPPPAFGFRFGQASTGALSQDKALLPSVASSFDVDAHGDADGLAALAIASERSEGCSDGEDERRADSPGDAPVVNMSD